MRCGLLLPEGVAPLRFDPVEPAITAEVKIVLPGRREGLTVSAVVDTGCPVDFIASPQLADDLRRQVAPARMEALDWGGRLDTEVFKVELKLAGWAPAEVHAPLEPFDENLLGLRALLKANLCIRGEDGSAYWARLPEAGEQWDFITRDAETQEKAPHAVKPVASSKRKRAR